MEFAHRGNEKIGKAVVVNRAVGESCPQDCYFLNNGCYAQFTELRFPNARHSGLANMEMERKTIERAILYAVKNTNGKLRIHERGDFARDNRLDVGYLDNWRSAIVNCQKNGVDIRGIWLYTHVYDHRIVRLADLGGSVYASVHNRKQLRKARSLGFTLFAYISKSRKKKGGSLDAPKYLTFDGKRFLVCPEQRLGRLRVTCCGSDKKGIKTTACNWCVFGKGNVAFLEH